MMTMDMWLGLIIIGAGMQGFLLTFYLLTSNKSNFEANAILALIVFSLSVDIFTAFLPSVKGSVQTNPTVLLYGPLIYLYVVSLCGPQLPIMRKFTYAVIFIYAVPVILYLFSVIRQFSDATGTGPFAFQMKHEFLGVDIFQLTPITMILFTVNIAGFLFLASKEVIRYYRKAQNYSSSGSILKTTRTYFILYLSALSLLVLLFLYLLTGSRIISSENAYQTLRWCMTFSIYLLGYITLKKPNMLLFKIPSGNVENLAHHQSAPPDTVESKEEFKALRDSVLKKRLLETMSDEKPYLNEDLSLTTLADILKVHPKLLSTVINSELNCTFFDFVNKYRVAEVKRRLADKASINQTIMTIAFECGFNTKSAFNAVFRKFENVTPTDFRKKSFLKKEKDNEQSKVLNKDKEEGEATAG
jgi:AraC-like DNA-binding protein